MSRLLLVLGLLSGLVPAVALAQAPGQGPPIPMAVDLTKVPVGTWAQYTVTMGQLAPMTTRMALVNKGVLETTVEGGMMAAAGGKMTLQMTLAPGGEKEGKVQKMLMQVGTADPMDFPVTPGQQQSNKPDPKRLIKEESITVKGGTFKTKHYRDKAPTGDAVDYWISDKVLPLGLVKMEAEQKQNPNIKGSIKFELTSTGKDAKPAITKPGKPFDQAAMIQQMMGGAKPGASAGAAPLPPPKK
jgi:hypothetical protein